MKPTGFGAKFARVAGHATVGLFFAPMLITSFVWIWGGSVSYSWKFLIPFVASFQWFGISLIVGVLFGLPVATFWKREQKQFQSGFWVNFARAAGHAAVGWFFAPLIITSFVWIWGGSVSETWKFLIPFAFSFEWFVISVIFGVLFGLPMATLWKREQRQFQFEDVGGFRERLETELKKKFYRLAQETDGQLVYRTSGLASPRLVVEIGTSSATITGPQYVLKSLEKILTK